MPSILPNDNDNTKPLTNGDGYQHEANIHLPKVCNDAFQHLPKPQQDILQLHGPRQKYSLDKAGEIPEVRSEREILIQVKANVLSSEDKLTFEGRSDWSESNSRCRLREFSFHLKLNNIPGLEGTVGMTY